MHYEFSIVNFQFSSFCMSVHAVDVHAYGFGIASGHCTGVGYVALVAEAVCAAWKVLNEEVD